jgi:hypothetical protein
VGSPVGEGSGLMLESLGYTNQTYNEHKAVCSRCAAVDQPDRKSGDGKRRCLQGAMMVKYLTGAQKGDYKAHETVLG